MPPRHGVLACAEVSTDGLVGTAQLVSRAALPSVLPVFAPRIGRALHASRDARERHRRALPLRPLPGSLGASQGVASMPRRRQHHLQARRTLLAIHQHPGAARQRSSVAPVLRARSSRRVGLRIQPTHSRRTSDSTAVQAPSSRGMASCFDRRKTVVAATDQLQLESDRRAHARGIFQRCALTIEPSWAPGLTGCHTYSICGGVEAIDVAAKLPRSLVAPDSATDAAPDCTRPTDLFTRHFFVDPAGLAAERAGPGR